MGRRITRRRAHIFKKRTTTLTSRRHMARLARKLQNSACCRTSSKVGWPSLLIEAGIYSKMEEHVLFLTILFQNLTDTKNAALPHELTCLIEVPPPSPWAFVAECAEAVVQEMDAGEAGSGKKRKW